MRAAVLAAFPLFTPPLEGRVPWMYLDIDGAVTTAVGNKIDSAAEATALNWYYPSGVLAVDADVIAAWERVKTATWLERDGGGAFENVTTLRLREEDIDKLVDETLASFEGVIKSRFKVWEELPADAQLGTLSMAWAMGPHFIYPRFSDDLIIRDFAAYTTAADGTRTLDGGCAIECYMPDAKNPGLKPRNARNRALFEAAQRVDDEGLDPDVLHYLDVAA